MRTIIALLLLTAPAFADDRLKELAELDALQKSADQMTGAAFQFGWACANDGHTWPECQKMFVDAIK